MSCLAFLSLPDVPEWFAWLKVVKLVKLVLVIGFLALVVIGKVESSRRGNRTADEDGA